MSQSDQNYAMSPRTLFSRLCFAAIISLGLSGCGRPVPSSAGTEGPSSEGRRAESLRAEGPGKSEPRSPSAVSVQSACNHTDRGALPYSVTVLPATAPFYEYPHERPAPLKTVSQGDALPVVDVSGQWFLVRFGYQRFAYVHCTNVKLTALAGHPVTAPIP